MLKVKKGQIYYADLSPVVGSEQGGLRPVCIASNDRGNANSPVVIVAPITSAIQKRRLPTQFIVKSSSKGLRCVYPQIRHSRGYHLSAARPDR